MAGSVETRLQRLEAQVAGRGYAGSHGSDGADDGIPDEVRFIRSLKIVDKVSGGLIDFDLWPCQVEMLAAMQEHAGLFILKCRQIGVTWLALCHALYLLTFWSHRTCLIGRPSGEDAVDAIRRLRILISTMPEQWRPSLERDNVWSLELGNGSRFEALTATQRMSRGRSAYIGLADEFAFWEWQAEQLAAFSEACERVFILTTGHGPGDYAERLWRQAQLGKGRYVPLFFPWSAHPDRDQHWYEKNVLEDAEPRLRRREHPSTPEEAFQAPEGAYFEVFSLERNVGDVSPVREWRTVRAVDFGFHHPACIWVQTSPSGQNFVVGEFVPAARERSASLRTTDFAAAILAHEQKLGLAGRVDCTFCDPAGRATNVQTAESEVEAFHQAGLCPVSKPSSVRDGAVKLMDMFGDPDLPLVIAKSCEWLVEAVPSITCDRNRPDVPDESSPYAHAIDALRYWAINTTPGPQEDWDPGEPAPGYSSGLRGRIW